MSSTMDASHVPRAAVRGKGCPRAMHLSRVVSSPERSEYAPHEETLTWDIFGG